MSRGESALEEFFYIYLAACGGFVVLAIFVLQVAAAIKVFFLDPETKKDIVDSVDQVETAEE